MPPDDNARPSLELVHRKQPSSPDTSGVHSTAFLLQAKSSATKLLVITSLPMSPYLLPHNRIIGTYSDSGGMWNLNNRSPK